MYSLIKDLEALALAKGTLNKPREKQCYLCGKSFLQVSCKGSSFCSTSCRNKSKISNDLEYKFNRLCNSAKNRAKIKSLPFDLTVKYLLDLYEEQEGLCALTSVAFDFEPHSRKSVANKDTISLDRIEPDMGYTKENVRLVTFQVNCAKGFYTDEEFYEMCANALRNRM